MPEVAIVAPVVTAVLAPSISLLVMVPYEPSVGATTWMYSGRFGVGRFTSCLVPVVLQTEVVRPVTLLVPIAMLVFTDVAVIPAE